MTRYPLRDSLAAAAALVGPLLIALMMVPFRADVSSTNLALLLVVVVVGVAALGNRVAGMLAALSAAAWYSFFLTRPYQSFNITSSDEVTTAVILLAVGIAVSILAAHARQLQVIVVTDADYLTRIHDTAQLAQSATSADTVVDHVKQQLTELLGLRNCRFEYGHLLGHPARLEQDGRLIIGRKQWDVDKRGWPAEEVEVRANGGGRFQGRFMLTPVPGARPSIQARLVATTLADQVGAALDTAGPGPQE